MKKLRVFIALLLVAALLAACGSTPVATEPPTDSPTAPSTEPPTDPPTDPPTEPPKEPIVDYHFVEPEGFVAVAATEEIGILAGPDGDGSSITVMKMNAPVDYDEVNEENFMTGLGIFGSEDEPPVLNAMEQTDIDGYPGLMVDYTMTVSGITARYQAYFVSDDDRTFVFIFADATADGAWADAFAASVASLNMLQEGEVIPVDTTGLELYDLGCGLSMYAAPGMEKLSYEGYAAYMANEHTEILVIEDNKSEYGLYGLSLDDYASLYVDGELITGFEQDPFGNLAATYITEGTDGTVFAFYVVAKNTADSFWLIQCACVYENAALYVEDYAQWCATITETK